MKKVIFKNTETSFFNSTKDAVDEYFYTNQLKKTGNWRLYIKAILCIPFAFVLYILLLFSHYTPVTGILLCITLGFTLCFIAINVMHDACHGSFSEKKWINAIMELTMNALGSNAFLWKIKHNILHHTYTNIDGIDNDIAQWPILRQSPKQKWKPAHRYQFVYMFPLYGISTLAWMLVADFKKYFSGEISSAKIKKISVKEHFLFWVSKILYVIFYVIIPCWLLDWQCWLTGFLIVHFTMGLSLTIIFQLAHLVGNTHFEAADKDFNQIDSEWAIHEILTTTNFATDNKILCWFAGGLNFQIEHHLFPRICHVHYPALSKIILNECARFHLPYHCYPTFSKAFISHIQFMKKLGKE